MSANQQTRRDFLTTSAATAAAVSAPWWLPTQARAWNLQSPNGRPVLGCIGTGDRWNAVGPQAMRFADCVAVCDVDRNHVEKGRKTVKDKQDRDAEMHEDYRRILDRDDIDVVTIVTPDHWHTKIAIEAMRAGKDVYCEKPLTLTIEEGKQVRQVLDETKRVFQVGTQQRSEMDQRFLKAVALCHLGRLGEIRKVTCGITGAPSSGPIPVAPVPEELNWEMWLGQAPMVDYRQGEFGNNKRYPESRTHYEFRWWYEYSGGKMTDWGAHHVDIAQWAIQQNEEGQGPVSVEGTAEHPVPFENGYPTLEDRYNAATKFNVTCLFPNGVEMLITSEGRNGILIEGTKGRIFVNREKLEGVPVDELEQNPLPDDILTKLYKGKEPGDHMRNFFECMQDRSQPVSDVYTHHRAMTTCHLANIAIRLGRKLEWDPQSEQITNDSQARDMQAREQRKGYEIDV